MSILYECKYHTPNDPFSKVFSSTRIRLLLAQTRELIIVNPTIPIHVVSDNLIFNLLALCAGIYLLHLWWSDTKVRLEAEEGEFPKGLLPGSTLAPARATLLAMVGAVAIVLAVTFLENKLGVSADQSTISWWFLPAMLGAAVTEEVIFRGYLVISNKGKWILITSILFFSTLFALLHPYLWKHAVEAPSGLQWITTLRLKTELQPLLATASIWLLSIWFYTVRFWPLNHKHSLLPCFSAHAAANLSVFIIKLTSGHVA